jgi:hypothetical protein
MPGIRRPLLCLGLTITWTCLALAPCAAGSDFRAERKQYRDYLDRPSFFMRHRGRVRFAETGDVRALEILAKSYARPEEPKDQVRYLLASTCAEHFDKPEHLPVLRKWRRKHARSRDAWLWYRALEVELENDGRDLVLDVARRHRDPFLRMAAVEVLDAHDDESTLPLVAELLAELPARPLDRMLLLETAAHVVYHQRRQRTTTAWKTVAQQVIQALDDPKTPERTRLVTARRLRRIFLEDELHMEAAPWLSHLADMKPTVTINRGPVKKPPKFLGLSATGRRIAYVIDMSDSMLTPLTDKEVLALRKPVPTGKKGKPDAPDPGVLDLPWTRIRTRFDAAREFLKASIRDLDAEASFCVIWFGSEAGFLTATPRLEPATRETVEQVCEELTAIVPGPSDESRPYGRLRGHTNLHGGLHRAFKVTDRTVVRRDEYVDPATFEAGVDAVFVLSDGKPTWDDWPERDRIEADDTPGDPETGTEGSGTMATFYGPYALTKYIRDDVLRLNLFRKVEIHCVGIGDYNPHLLEWIRRNGLGERRFY